MEKYFGIVGRGLWLIKKGSTMSLKNESLEQNSILKGYHAKNKER